MDLEFVKVDDCSEVPAPPSVNKFKKYQHKRTIKKTVVDDDKFNDSNFLQSAATRKRSNIKSEIISSTKLIVKKNKIVPPTTDRVDERSLFRCNLCNITYNKISILEVHVRTHFDDKPYKCSLCDDDFWAADSLISHCRELHQDAKDKLLFNCRFCDKKFEQEIDFREHDTTHTNEKPYDCSECGEDFWSLSALNSHKRIHFGDKPYKCNECDRRYTRSEDLNTHSRIHKGLAVFECTLCDRMFAQSKTLGSHVRKAHRNNFKSDELSLIDFVVDGEVNERIQNISEQPRPDVSGEQFKLDVVSIVRNINSEDCIATAQMITNSSSNVEVKTELIRKYKCPFCVLLFVKIKSLEIHCKRNHEKIYKLEELRQIERDVADAGIKSELSNERPELTKIANVIPKNQNCPSCNLVFPSRSLLISHLYDQHDASKPYKCAECSMNFSKSKTLSDHVTIHLDASRHKCQYCGLSFLQMHSMQKHRKRHEGPNLRNCTVCNIPYANQKDLDRHMRTHAEGKPHKCDYCEKRFAQSCDKVKHMRIHTGERPYCCKVCGKTFAHLTSIKKHNFVHTGERPFQCTICGKSFQHNSNLVVHNRTHTGERPYQCQICKKTFYASGHYADHMKIHNGKKDYECDICGKSFIHQSSFQKHKRTHTGEKPYHCTLCDRRFSQPGHYREHMRIHTGEKPYKCKICRKSFRRSDALQSHIKTHPIDPKLNEQLNEFILDRDNDKNKILEQPTSSFVKYQLSYEIPSILKSNPFANNEFVLPTTCSHPNIIVHHDATDKLSDNIVVLKNPSIDSAKSVSSNQAHYLSHVINLNGSAEQVLNLPESTQLPSILKAAHHSTDEMLTTTTTTADDTTFNTFSYNFSL